MLVANFLIVVFLILLNGFFAMSELAVVSSRRAPASSRWHRTGREGRKGRSG